jgi:hypothetical protein
MAESCGRKKHQHKIPHGYLKSWAFPDSPPGQIGKMWVDRITVDRVNSRTVDVCQKELEQGIPKAR